MKTKMKKEDTNDNTGFNANGNAGKLIWRSSFSQDFIFRIMRQANTKHQPSKLIFFPSKLIFFPARL